MVGMMQVSVGTCLHRYQYLPTYLPTYGIQLAWEDFDEGETDEI